VLQEVRFPRARIRYRHLPRSGRVPSWSPLAATQVAVPARRLQAPEQAARQMAFPPADPQLSPTLEL
jgi:hypothetical protein